MCKCKIAGCWETSSRSANAIARSHAASASRVSAPLAGWPVFTSHNFQGVRADYKNISEAIHRVLSNDGYKSQLVKKGIDRLKQFSWEKAASQTLRVIENSFEKKGGN